MRPPPAIKQGLPLRQLLKTPQRTPTPLRPIRRRPPIGLQTVLPPLQIEPLTTPLLLRVPHNEKPRRLQMLPQGRTRLDGELWSHAARLLFEVCLPSRVSTLFKRHDGSVPAAIFRRPSTVTPAGRHADGLPIIG